jgi:hypothetical protein
MLKKRLDTLPHVCYIIDEVRDLNGTRPEREKKQEGKMKKYKVYTISFWYDDETNSTLWERHLVARSVLAESFEEAKEIISEKNKIPKKKLRAFEVGTKVKLCGRCRDRYTNNYYRQEYFDGLYSEEKEVYANV